MNPNENNEIGLNHPTTDVSKKDEKLHRVKGLAYDHGDRYELLALEYDGTPIEGSTALQLYTADLSILYEDLLGNSAFDTGETTWGEVKDRLGE